MSSRSMTHSIGRVASVMIVGLVSLLAACEAKMPTAAEIDRMDASSVEKSARAMGIMQGDSSVLWWVDGVHTTAAVAKAIPADSIVTVSITGPELSGFPGVYVLTKRGQQSALASGGQTGLVRRRNTGDPLDATAVGQQPTIMIDGVRATEAAMKALDRSRIENIEIIKGAGAIREYGDDAKNGIILIKTKPAGAK